MTRKIIKISALIIIIFSRLGLASAEKHSKPIVVKKLSWGRCYLGKTALKVKIKNESDKDKMLLAELLVYPVRSELEEATAAPLGRTSNGVKDSAGEGERYTSLVKLEGRRTKEIKMVYGIKDEGEYDLCLSIIDPGSKQVYWTSSSSCSIPRNKTRVKSLLKDIIKIKFSLLSLKGEKNLSEDVDKVFKRLVSIKEKVDKRMGKKDWMECAQDLKIIESKVDLLKEKVSKKKMPVYPYVVTIENNLTKVFKDDLLAGKITKEVKLSAAKNEYEGFQVILIPLDKELKKVKVEVSDLIGKRASIKKENIKLNLVGYVKTRRPAYKVERVGYHPDPLFHYEPFDVNKDDVQVIWVTIYTPGDMKAGLYEGEIKIEPDNAKGYKMRLKIKVFDFELPIKPSLRTEFGLSLGSIKDFYGYKELDDELIKKYYKFMLEHKLSFGYPKLTKDHLDYCIKYGLNGFHIGYGTSRVPFKSKEEEDKFKEGLKRHLLSLYPLLVKEGYIELAFMYSFDEPQMWPGYEESKKKIRNIFGMVKELAPKLKRLCTVYPDPDLYSYVDIWVPVLNEFDKYKERCYERQQSGEEIWYYVCCGPLHPYPNFFIDYPGIDHRILFWMAWKYKLQGFLYWTVNAWGSNTYPIDEIDSQQVPQEDEIREGLKKGKRWPEIPWNTFTYSYFNGDGHLIYPGPDKEPLSSIRLESIRDGIEDYEHLCILRQKLENLKKVNKKKYQKIKERAERVLKVPDALAKDLKNYSKDPEELYKLRNEIANLIEE